MKIDLILKNANIYNVFLNKWEHSDLWILKKKILYIGDSSKYDVSANHIIDVENKYIIPSFIDIHMHIESSLCTPKVFAQEVIKHGITTVVAEPHEMANVFGKKGISKMIEQSKNPYIDIFYGLPSSVPSTSYDLENNGGEITSKEIDELMNEYNEIICLGEVMQYRTFINEFENIAINNKKNKTIELIDKVKEKNQLFAIEGHCPSVKDLELASLLYFGVNSDHCLHIPSTMIDRFKQGMFVQIQDKSITKENIDVLIDGKYRGLYSFVTDDCPPNIIIEQGHLENIIRKAIELGLPFEEAITAGSYSPAKRMGFRDRGAIAPGYIADFLIIDKPTKDFNIEKVFKNGNNLILDNININSTTKNFPNEFYNSINVNKKFNIQKALTINVENNKSYKVKVMRKNSKSTYTDLIEKNFNAINNELDWEYKDTNLVLSINRYNQNSFGCGFMDGTSIKNGAFCTSHAHDSHNILLLGDNKKDMETAYKRLLEIQGGLILISDGKIINEIPLSVAGIISEINMKDLSNMIIKLQNNLVKYGVNHANPLMSLTTLSLPVSPSVKISDKGLIDVKSQKIINLYN